MIFNNTEPVAILFTLELEMIMKKIIFASLLITGFINPAFAKPDHGHFVEHIISELNLPDAQAIELRVVFEAGLEERKAIKEEIKARLDAVKQVEMEQAADFLTAEELLHLEEILEQHKKHHPGRPPRESIEMINEE